MNSSYIKALETKADWLEWSKTVDASQGDRGLETLYKTALASDNTFVMNSRFADLVDHARMSVPDDVVWDNTWVQSPTGFLWIENEVALPPFVLDFNSPSLVTFKNAATIQQLDAIKQAKVTLPAVGWVPIEKVETLPDGRAFGHTSHPGRMTDATAFVCFFQDNFDAGFSPWAYFTIKTGDKLIDKVRSFEQFAEKAGGAYPGDRTTEILHEVRWIYTAFHLMAQRLAIGIDLDTDRATRRRAERDKKSVPAKFRVISLRRMERARAATGETANVDWQWQWAVRGHWRNQWCPSTKTHKQVFVEAYIKGPEGKPMKDPSQKLFTAVR